MCAIKMNFFPFQIRLLAQIPKPRQEASLNESNGANLFSVVSLLSAGL